LKKLKAKYFNRDLSWLSFNYRVLQEAKNKEVPLLERLKFLAIYSSNLDEFYRVRVGLLRAHLMQPKDTDSISRKKLLTKIQKKVGKQLNEFGNIYRGTLLPQLARNRIFIRTDSDLNKDQKVFTEAYFRSVILPELKLAFLDGKNKAPFLENKQLYFALKLKKLSNKKTEYAILNIPSEKLPRFIKLPSRPSQHAVIFLDDIIRSCMHFLFLDHTVKSCHAIKISRDADLDLEEDDDLVKEIKSKLVKRKTNPPSRFLYDNAMPKDMLNHLREMFSSVKDFIIPGGRYHNFEDFFAFPAPDIPKLKYPELPELTDKAFDHSTSFFDTISSRDQILHFPYQSYDYVINFLEQAAMDPAVTRIKITLYRVPDDSKIANTLIKAAANKKDVSVFMEVKARFSEMVNIYWAQKFEEAGIKVIYSFRKIKVHGKICLIERMEKEKKKRYAYLSTGNFHEKTARIYCDYGYFTARKELTKETEKIFQYFNPPHLKPTFRHFLVAPFNLRNKLKNLIHAEIRNAKAKKKATIIIKVNNLEDSKIIDLLYAASRAGVKITIIVRGICCLIPGVKDLSENIKVISIVDRYLEHGRVFIFHANGKERMYISSADLMTRNLSRRIEAVFPVYDEQAKQQIRHAIGFQLKDNTKARKLNKTQSNPYKQSKSRKKIRAQLDTYKYLAALA
jgi:polyphosphate kinase